MELKLTFLIFGNWLYLRSNRTFMELKFNKETSSNNYKTVLIVPLWN